MSIRLKLSSYTHLNNRQKYTLPAPTVGWMVHPWIDWTKLHPTHHLHPPLQPHPPPSIGTTASFPISPLYRPPTPYSHKVLSASPVSRAPGVTTPHQHLGTFTILSCIQNRCYSEGTKCIILNFLILNLLNWALEFNQEKQTQAT